MVSAQVTRLQANGKIAFTSDRDGNLEIYVMNNDGTGQMRLTDSTVTDFLPDFSPAGSVLYFSSTREAGSGSGDLYNGTRLCTSRK